MSDRFHCPIASDASGQSDALDTAFALARAETHRALPQDLRARILADAKQALRAHDQTLRAHDQTMRAHNAYTPQDAHHAHHPRHAPHGAPDARDARHAHGVSPGVGRALKRAGVSVRAHLAVWLGEIRDGFGGMGAVAGLAGAMVAGVWIGGAQPWEDAHDTLPGGSVQDAVIEGEALSLIQTGDWAMLLSDDSDLWEDL